MSADPSTFPAADRWRALCHAYAAGAGFPALDMPATAGRPVPAGEKAWQAFCAGARESYLWEAAIGFESLLTPEQITRAAEQAGWT